MTDTLCNCHGANTTEPRYCKSVQVMTGAVRSQRVNVHGNMRCVHKSVNKTGHAMSLKIDTQFIYCDDTANNNNYMEKNVSL